MCTVTFVARGNGYCLGMNRDEKRVRAAALPPAHHAFGATRALYPSEPAGGTWIGVNSNGASLALINWYAVPAEVTGGAVSRGEVVRAAVWAASPPGVDAVLGNLPLGRMNPFRLIGMFPASRGVVEWRWNLTQLDRLEHAWTTGHWVSSGFDEAGAQEARAREFQRALCGCAARSMGELRRLHRSHSPERGPYSTCMHRKDAATVSYTEVSVTPRMASLSYTPGPPCRTPPLPALRVQLRR